MRLSSILLLAALLAAGSAAAEDKKPPKAKPAAKSDKNVFQKTESSIGEWAHRNKIWVRHRKNEKAKKD